MKITTISHEDRYSIEQISCLFFEKDAEVEIVSEYNGNEETIFTTVRKEKNVAVKSYPADNSDIKNFKNSVKKSAFLAMKELSDAETPWGILTGIRPTKFCIELAKSYGYEKVKEILVNDYWVSKEKAEFCIEVAKNSEKLIKRIEPGTIAVYAGVPFCPGRCSYCSFVSESAALYSKYIPEYTEALVKEIKATAALAKDLGLKVSSVYFGGGTPPTLGTEGLSGAIKCALEEFDFSTEDFEFTVEAGRPDVINKDLLKMLKSNGVSRLCINPQTLNDETLKIIGRNHSAKDVGVAFALAREHGFDNINSDLIAGLPGENPEMFLNTLEKIEVLSPESITVHTMYLKRTSRIAKEKKWSSCGRDVGAMLDASLDFAKRNDYTPYYMYKQRSTLGNLENTGYAKAGCESIYNSAIMEEVQTIFACGAGASSKIILGDNLERVYNIKDAFSYIRDIDTIIDIKIKKIKKLLNGI